MADSKRITPNYILCAGFRNSDAVRAFKVLRHYEPFLHLETAGRSFFRELKGVIGSCAPDVRAFNLALGAMTGEYSTVGEILIGPEITEDPDMGNFDPSVRCSDLTLDGLVVDKSRPVHLNADADIDADGSGERVVEDGNSLDKGLYAHARRAMEQRGTIPDDYCEAK